MKSELYITEITTKNTTETPTLSLQLHDVRERHVAEYVEHPDLESVLLPLRECRGPHELAEVQRDLH